MLDTTTLTLKSGVAFDAVCEQQTDLLGDEWFVAKTIWGGKSIEAGPKRTRRKALASLKCKVRKVVENAT